MEAPQVEAVLAGCERALAAGGKVDLKALGFWRAVAAVKRRPEWVERYAARIADVDRRAFLRRVPIALPLPYGVAMLALGTVVGVGFMVAGFVLTGDLAGIALLLGTGAVLVATHDLAHLVVGSLAGIAFTHAYVAPPEPQPGLKIDYASYLRTHARARAWMHASGAIVSKVVPFAALPLAALAATPWWTSAILLALGVVQLATDALFSVRSSDWKRFRREMRLASS